MNKIINEHIKNMFQGFDNEEILEIKKELIRSSNDKHNDLLSQGVSEYESIGRVLSEIGSINEILKEFDLVEKNSNLNKRIVISKPSKLAEKLISILFILVTTAYLITGFVWSLWGTLWIMFPIAALIAAIINIIFTKEKK